MITLFHQEIFIFDTIRKTKCLQMNVSTNVLGSPHFGQQIFPSLFFPVPFFPLPPNCDTPSTPLEGGLLDWNSPELVVMVFIKMEGDFKFRILSLQNS